MSRSAESIKSSAAVRGWLRRNPYLLAGLVLFLGMAVPCLLRNNSEWDDVYVRAANHLRAGESIYQPGEGYVYPPFMALAALPCTILPTVVERLAFYVVSITSAVCLCRWAWQLAGGGSMPGLQLHDFREHWIWWLGLACGFRYVIDALSHQQTDLVIGALLLGGCAALFRARPYLAATLFGLAAAAKCTPLLWCGYLLWRGQGRAAAWLVAVAVGVNLIPNLIAAPADGTLWVVRWYHECLVPMTRGGDLPGRWYSDPVYNQSLAGAAHRWCATAWTVTGQGFTLVSRENSVSVRLVKAVLYTIAAALLAGALLALGRRRGEPPGEADLGDGRRVAWEYSVVLLLMLLLSPMSSKPHFCTLLLPGFCLARRALTERNWLVGVVLVLAILAGASGTKGLVGSDAASVALWWGNVMWSTLLLLAGCVYGLWYADGAAEMRSRSARVDKQAA